MLQAVTLFYSGNGNIWQSLFCASALTLRKYLLLCPFALAVLTNLSIELWRASARAFKEPYLYTTPGVVSARACAWIAFSSAKKSCCTSLTTSHNHLWRTNKRRTEIAPFSGWKFFSKTLSVPTPAGKYGQDRVSNGPH